LPVAVGAGDIAVPQLQKDTGFRRALFTNVILDEVGVATIVDNGAGAGGEPVANLIGLFIA